MTRLERDLELEFSSTPIAEYAKTLRILRNEVKDVAAQGDEIAFGLRFRDALSELSERLQLPDDHFSVDTAGSPLLVKEGSGEHLISPTHFENGAYLSHPHADHQLDLPANQLPRIKIGRYVRFGRNAAVNAGGDVTIGNGAWLSPGSQLLRQDHDAYGRPSVGARTVAMTKLPPIVLEDYAWVGRETMVGWSADYIGRCSIVATRAFLNTWVGDYSVAGDRGKILQYMPFKAYLVEQKGASFEDLLRIVDWGGVNEEWIAHYRSEVEPQVRSAEISKLDDVDGDALVIAPRTPADLLSIAGLRTDVISDERLTCSSLLQWCIDNRKFDLRFRGDLRRNLLPFPTAGRFHYRRRSGYGTLLSFDRPSDQAPDLVREMLRVAREQAAIIVTEEFYETLDRGSLHSEDGLLKPEGGVLLGSEKFVFLRKT